LAGELVRNPNQETGISKVYFSGAGGIMTTAADYLQFAQLMLKWRPTQRQALSQSQDG